MESSPLTPVAPARPPAPWVGGKRALSARICKLIAATPHTVFAEAFVGMGGVFFRRELKPKSEIINDWSGDVANLFRILQRHYPQFMDTLKFQLSGRREWNRLMATDPATLTDLERAARFLYLQRLAFGGKVEGRNLGVSYGRPANFDVTRLASMLEDVHERLAGVLIENLPFDTFIARYDRAETLFYCDPPYWGTEDYYGKAQFRREDFERLAAVLQALKGRFILSINDVPEIRALFAWALIEPVGLKYGLAATGAVEARELIITGGG